jgi:hypothetical protein
MDTTIIKAKQLIKRSSDILASEVDGEIVMMSIEHGKYFGLDDVGSEIWKRLENEISFGKLCDDLAKDYDVDLATITRDVSTFIESLIENEIVVIN